MKMERPILERKLYCKCFFCPVCKNGVCQHNNSTLACRVRKIFNRFWKIPKVKNAFLKEKIRWENQTNDRDQRDSRQNGRIIVRLTHVEINRRIGYVEFQQGQKKLTKALLKALDKAEADTKRQQRQYKGAQDALKRVMAERAEDKKRLDFWIKNHHAITCISDQPKIYEFYNGHMPRYQADNILDLIDKAMVDKNIDTKQ